MSPDQGPEALSEGSKRNSDPELDADMSSTRGLKVPGFIFWTSSLVRAQWSVLAYFLPNSSMNEKGSKRNDSKAGINVVIIPSFVRTGESVEGGMTFARGLLGLDAGYHIYQDLKPKTVKTAVYSRKTAKSVEKQRKFERKLKKILTNFSGTPYTPSKEDSRLKNEKNSFLQDLKPKTVKTAVYSRKTAKSVGKQRKFERKLKKILVFLLEDERKQRIRYLQIDIKHAAKDLGREVVDRHLLFNHLIRRSLHLQNREAKINFTKVEKKEQKSNREELKQPARCDPAGNRTPAPPYEEQLPEDRRKHTRARCTVRPPSLWPKSKSISPISR
ncbi:hypothetical protein M5K25_028097 [Dendrobium thyrsiflorum]|uniref:Uncharacterized protein n=1 Tax=Dendrobium thyrsiflorum TaxID=117978 RepID=A0ABD0TW17_DENTH